MWWARSELAAAEARKAEGASCTELLIPSPHSYFGKKHVENSSSRDIILIQALIPFTSESGA